MRRAIEKGLVISYGLDMFLDTLFRCVVDSKRICDPISQLEIFPCFVYPSQSLVSRQTLSMLIGTVGSDSVVNSL